MSGLLQSLVWRGISEYMLVHQDIKRFRGKKNVVAVMAMDRNHPEFVRASEMFSGTKDAEIAFVTEDHPRGPIHDRLKCDDQEFCFCIINKEGTMISKDSHALSPTQVRERLGLH